MPNYVELYGTVFDTIRAETSHFPPTHSTSHSGMGSGAMPSSAIPIDCNFEDWTALVVRLVDKTRMSATKPQKVSVWENKFGNELANDLPAYSIDH